MPANWEAEDSDRAQAQGWDIFTTNGYPDRDKQVVNGKPYGNRPFEIQRLDEDAKFKSDADVFDFIRSQIAQGDPLAIKAHDFLRENSPAEYAAIFEAADDNEDDEDTPSPGIES